MAIAGNATKSTNWTKDVKKEDSFCKDPRNTDLVIALMGPTGAGKSTFINTFMSETVAAVGNDLESKTDRVDHFFFNDPKYPGRRIVLIDTPGFNDTYVDDDEILRRIAVWLIRSYNADMKLSGLIYLHDILGNRIAGSAKKNLELFQQLCGEEASRKVVFATTMWSEIRDPKVGELREQQLKDTFWKDMLAQGSNVARFDTTQPTAEAIVHSLLEQNRFSPIQIQRELGDQDKSISETAAALALSRVQEPRNLPSRATLNRPKPAKFRTKPGWMTSVSEEDSFIRDPRDTDRVIVVLGPTGSGKSTFINTLIGKDVALVGHGLQSVTMHMQHFTFRDPGSPEHRIVVVDAPGFDHTFLGEREVAAHIIVWLARSYDANMKLAGLIYLQSILSPHRSDMYRAMDPVFEQIGKEGSKKLILVTTHWGEVTSNDDTRREEHLRWLDFKKIFDREAVMVRFTDSQRSAQDIVQSLIKRDDQPLQIQREMADMGKTFMEAGMGSSYHHHTPEDLMGATNETAEELREGEDQREQSCLQAVFESIARIGEYVYRKVLHLLKFVLHLLRFVLRPLGFK